MMRVLHRTSAALLVGAAMIAGCGGGGSDEAASSGGSEGKPSGSLLYAGWGGQAAETLQKYMFEPFSESSGITVETTAAPGEFVPKLQAQVNAGQVQWDLLNPIENDALVLYEKGLLRELPADLKSFLISEVGEEHVTEYGVAINNYSDVIACNPDVVEKCPTTLPEFWDTEAFPGDRAMYADGWDVNMVYALGGAGVPRDQVFPDVDIDAAFASLDTIKPGIDVWWKTGDQSQQILRDKEVGMALMWDGRAYQLRDDAIKDLEISHDGMVLSRDMLVVPADSPNPEATWEFLRWYATHPEEQARYVADMGYGVANQKVFDYMSKADAGTIATAPENVEVMIPADAQWSVQHRDELVTRFTNWLGQ